MNPNNLSSTHHDSSLDSPCNPYKRYRNQWRMLSCIP